MPGNDRGASLEQFVNRWIDQPAVRRVVEAHGGTWPEGPIRERVQALHSFSDRWDFRRGFERDSTWPLKEGVDADAAMAAAVGLGMARSTPPTRGRYDHAVVLGGTILSSVCRLRHLLQLQAGGLEVGAAAALTALRPISGGERDIAAANKMVPPAVLEARTEFDVFVLWLAEALRQPVEGLASTSAVASGASAVARVGDVDVLAAPSSDPARRANTQDNVSSYAPRIRAGDSILVVTSAIYLPYQLLVMARMLGSSRAFTLEAVGFPPSWMGGVLTGPTNVLQELRSAFFAARTVLEAGEDSVAASGAS